MASTLLAHRTAYYAALEHAHGTLEITDWLLWFAAKAIEAQRRTLQQREFVLTKARIMASLHGKLNPRQEPALMRMFAAGPNGFVGGLSAANYMTITGAPSATTTHDLAALVGLGALLRLVSTKPRATSSTSRSMRSGPSISLTSAEFFERHTQSNASTGSCTLSMRGVAIGRRSGLLEGKPAALNRAMRVFTAATSSEWQTPPDNRSDFRRRRDSAGYGVETALRVQGVDGAPGSRRRPPS
jgi:hypothetical protein